MQWWLWGLSPEFPLLTTWLACIPFARRTQSQLAAAWAQGQACVFSWHLSTSQVIWIFEETMRVSVGANVCSVGLFASFPEIEARVSMEPKISDCIVWRKWKGNILSLLPGSAWHWLQPLTGSWLTGSWRVDPATVIAHLSWRQKKNESCYLIYSDGSLNCGISWTDLISRKQRLTRHALLENYLSVKRSLFFPPPAMVTNSLRYKIKITYFVINILIY